MAPSMLLLEWHRLQPVCLAAFAVIPTEAAERPSRRAPRAFTRNLRAAICLILSQFGREAAEAERRGARSETNGVGREVFERPDSVF